MELKAVIDNKTIHLQASIWTGKITLTIDNKEVYSSMKMGIASTIGDIFSFFLGGFAVFLLMTLL